MKKGRIFRPFFLYLLMHAFVFVVVAVVGASLGIKTEEITHFILIQREGAGISVDIFIVLIEFAAFTARFVLDPVF
jgi:hypothetical protein